MSEMPKDDMRTEPDPVLLVAMEEIKATLRRHDIAGVVILSSAEAMEHLTHLEASWNCIEMNRECCRINSTKVPAERKKQVVEATLGLVFGIDHVLDIFKENLVAVFQLIGRSGIEVQNVIKDVRRKRGE